MPGPIDLERHTFRTDRFRKVVDEALSFFNETQVCELSFDEPFEGPGVYALYYVGDSPYYTEVTADEDDPGKGRYDQAVSEWDALHSGRPWVEKLQGERPTPEEAFSDVPERWRPSRLP